MGRHPLQLYSLATPNGVKVTVMLEELLALGHAGAEYDAWLIRINKGEQFGSGFVAANPNSKIPALVDRSGPKPIRVFESGAILLYLAEKFGAFIPAEPEARAACLSWLFWQMGSAPYLGGGFGHFYAYAPVKIEYAINRFAMEVKRQLDVLDRHLADSEYLAGDEYTHCRHGHVALVRRAGQGPGLRARASSSACRTTRTCSAGPSRSPRVRRSSAAAWSTARRARRPASCTSATTPATSTRARRTRSARPERAGGARRAARRVPRLPAGRPCGTPPALDGAAGSVGAMARCVSGRSAARRCGPRCPSACGRRRRRPPRRNARRTHAAAGIPAGR